jgi:tripartite-type tricarboxylate transporter receptor subunit TctC
VDYSAEAFFTKKGGPYDIPLKELVKRAKERPGAIKIGVGGSVWGAQDFARAFFEDVANIKLNRVPFPGVSDLIPSVMGGHVDIAVGPSAEWAPYYKAGQFSVLAVCMDKRDPRYPDIPTSKELGYDVVLSAYHWIGTPVKTPDPIIAFLAEAFKKAFAEQGFKDGCDTLGGTAAWEGPENSLKTMEKVEQLYMAVIKKFDLKPQ